MILLKLLLIFAKIGAFTFGGGYAMLPLIQEEVLANGWLDEQALVNFIAVSESTPGPFAVNIATYVGRQTAGIPGAICATLGVVLPSFIIILIVARCYDKFKSSRIVEGCMDGLRPAVIGLIAAAVLSVAKTAFPIDFFNIGGTNTYELLCSLIIFAAAAFMAFKKKLHPILIILLSAALGIAFGYAVLLF